MRPYATCCCRRAHWLPCRVPRIRRDDAPGRRCGLPPRESTPVRHRCTWRPAPARSSPSRRGRQRVRRGSEGGRGAAGQRCPACSCSGSAPAIPRSRRSTTPAHLIAQYEVTVPPSLSARRGAGVDRPPGCRQPDHGAATAKGLLLSRPGRHPGEAAQAAAIAQGYRRRTQAVENQISIQSSIQVTLQVRIAEMSRQVVRNLGVNWQALGNDRQDRSDLPALALNANASPVTCGGTTGRCSPSRLQRRQLQWRDRRAGPGQPCAYPRRAKPDGDERPAGQASWSAASFRSRFPKAERRDLRRFQEIRRVAHLRADGVQRRPDQCPCRAGGQQHQQSPTR